MKFVSGDKIKAVLAWEYFKRPVILPLLQESKIKPASRSDTSLSQQTTSLKQAQRRVL